MCGRPRVSACGPTKADQEVKVTPMGKGWRGGFKGKLHARYLAFLCTLYIRFCHPASRLLRHLSRLIRSREYIVSLACACFCFDLDVGPEAKALRTCSPRSPVSVELVCFCCAIITVPYRASGGLPLLPVGVYCAVDSCVVLRDIRLRMTSDRLTTCGMTNNPEHTIHAPKQTALCGRWLIQTRSSSPGRGRRR